MIANRLLVLLSVLAPMVFTCIGWFWGRNPGIVARCWFQLLCLLGFHQWTYTPDNKLRRCLRGCCGRIEEKVFVVESELTGYATVHWVLYESGH